MKFYCVRIGRKPGIYNDWPSCHAQVSGFPGAVYKSFLRREDALDFLGFPSEPLVSGRIAYTDGSSYQNNGGYGVLFLPDRTEKSGRIPDSRATNQLAELYAIHVALRERDVTEIRTDSRYSIDAITNWSKTWKQNGWKTSKGEPVLHQDLIRAILDQLENRNVTFTWVKGHSGCKYNERVDQLANQSRICPAPSEVVSRSGAGFLVPIPESSTSL